MRVITFDEWMDEGQKLFGWCFMKWKFICPICKRIQTPQDILEYVDMKNFQGVVAYSCIGRLNNSGISAMKIKSEQKPNHGKGCDWTLGGFFKFHETEITAPWLESNRGVFEFYKE